jgi:hypothetical protein
MGTKQGLRRGGNDRSAWSALRPSMRSICGISVRQQPVIRGQEPSPGCLFLRNGDNVLLSLQLCPYFVFELGCSKCCPESLDGDGGKKMFVAISVE